MCGAALPIAVALAAFLLVGAWSDAYYWVIGYNCEFVRSPLSWAQGGEYLWLQLSRMSLSDGLVWCAALLGSIIVWRPRPQTVGHRWLLGWLVVAALSVVPGRFFLSYYFTLFALPLALLAAVGLNGLIERVRAGGGAVGRAVAWGVAIGVIASPMVAHAGMFRLSPSAFAERMYRENIFIEAEALGRYLAQHTTPQETILVVGSEPEILFYARRRSATKYIFFYPLTSWLPRSSAMREEFFAELDRGRSRYIVVMTLPSSWIRVWEMASQQPFLERIQAAMQGRYALEAALVSRGQRPYALVPARRSSDLDGERVVAFLLRRLRDETP